MTCYYFGALRSKIILSIQFTNQTQFYITIDIRKAQGSPLCAIIDSSYFDEIVYSITFRQSQFLNWQRCPRVSTVIPCCLHIPQCRFTSEIKLLFSKFMNFLNLWGSSCRVHRIVCIRLEISPARSSHRKSSKIREFKRITDSGEGQGYRKTCELCRQYSEEEEDR